MKLKFLKSFGFLSVFLLLSGWSAVAVAVVAQEQPAQAEAEQAVDVSNVPAEKGSFVYSSKGRRDPFKPLIDDKIKEVKKVSGRSDKVKGPLEKFELSQYRLIALMVVKGVPRAMLKAPDGKSYTVKVGEYIGLNDGIVKNIETKIVGVDENGMRVEKSPDRIVVEEAGVDSYTGSDTKINRYIVM